jgi:hypothetical protein
MVGVAEVPNVPNPNGVSDGPAGPGVRVGPNWPSGVSVGGTGKNVAVASEPAKVLRGVAVKRLTGDSDGRLQASDRLIKSSTGANRRDKARRRGTAVIIACG